MWLIVIAIESTSLLSADNTGRFLYPVFHFLTGMDAARFDAWHHYLRKGGHFVGFFLLSWLLFRSWRATLPAIDLRAWTFQWATIAYLMAPWSPRSMNGTRATCRIAREIFAMSRWIVRRR